MASDKPEAAKTAEVVKAPTRPATPQEKALIQIKHLLDIGRPEIQKALPRMVPVDRVIRVAVTSVQRSPSLLECTPLSVVGCVIEAAQLGLSVDGSLGHAYLVPFKTRCSLIVGYRGLIYLASRSGVTSTVESRVVYNDEHFEYELGLKPRIVHVPILRAHPNKPDEIKAAYCVVRLRDGGRVFDVMSKPEIDAIRARSKAGKEGPWVTDYVAMAQKTVARRTLKWVPMSADAGSLTLQAAIGTDEAHEVHVADPEATARLALPAIPSEDVGGSTEDRAAAMLGDERQPGEDG